MEDTFSHKYLFRFLSFTYDGCKHPPLGGPSKGQFDVCTQLGHIEAWEGRNERELQLPLGCFFEFSLSCWRIFPGGQIAESSCLKSLAPGGILLDLPSLQSCLREESWRKRGSLVTAAKASFSEPLSSYHDKWMTVKAPIHLSLSPHRFSCSSYWRTVTSFGPGDACKHYKQKCEKHCVSSLLMHICQENVPGSACWRDAWTAWRKAKSPQDVWASDNSWSALRPMSEPSQDQNHPVRSKQPSHKLMSLWAYVIYHRILKSFLMHHYCVNRH